MSELLGPTRAPALGGSRLPGACPRESLRERSSSGLRAPLSWASPRFWSRLPGETGNRIVMPKQGWKPLFQKLLFILIIVYQFKKTTTNLHFSHPPGKLWGYLNHTKNPSVAFHWGYCDRLSTNERCLVILCFCSSLLISDRLEVRWLSRVLTVWTWTVELLYKLWFKSSLCLFLWMDAFFSSFVEFPFISL